MPYLSQMWVYQSIKVSSLAPIAAGYFVKHFAAAEGTDMETSMRRVAASVGVCGLCMSALHYTYCRHLHIAPEGAVAAKKKKDKKAMSLGESVTFLSQSTYLGCMAVSACAGHNCEAGDIKKNLGCPPPSPLLALGHGPGLRSGHPILGHHVEVYGPAASPRAHRVPGATPARALLGHCQGTARGSGTARALLGHCSVTFGGKNFRDCDAILCVCAAVSQRYIATFSSRVGVATFLVIFLGSNLIKHVGWRAGALATPLTMGLLGAPFFGVVLASRSAGALGGDRLALVVFFGALQGLVAKALKSALFDPTTQMAYIPLDQESKVKGKAAIDVLGSRFGKSGCALLQQMLVVSFGTISDAAHVIFVLFYVVRARDA